MLISSSIYRPGANAPVTSSTNASEFTRMAKNSLVSPQLSSKWGIISKFGGHWKPQQFPHVHEEPSTLLLPQLWVCGLSFFPIGIQQADEEEMRLMASTPYSSHIYSVATFDMIKNVQKQLITRMCAGVEDQLNVFVSGDECETSLKLLLLCLVWVVKKTFSWSCHLYLCFYPLIWLNMLDIDCSIHSYFLSLIFYLIFPNIWHYNYDSISDFCSCWASLQSPGPGSNLKVHAVDVGPLYRRCFRIQDSVDPHDDWQHASGTVCGRRPDLGGGPRSLGRYRVPNRSVCLEGTDTQWAHHGHAEDSAS